MSGVKTISLHPFKGEDDDLRTWDLIRGVIIFMTVREHANKSKDAIKGKFIWYRLYDIFVK